MKTKIQIALHKCQIAGSQREFFILLHRKHINDIIIITPAPTWSNGPIGWLHQQNLYGVWSPTNIKIWRAPNNNHVTSHLPCSVSSHVQTIQWSNEVKFTRLKMLTNSKNDDLLVNPFASHIIIINPWPGNVRYFPLCQTLLLSMMLMILLT